MRELYIVVIGQSSGIAVLQNVHIVEAESKDEAKWIAAGREPTTGTRNCHAEPFSELGDGWRYFT